VSAEGYPTIVGSQMRSNYLAAGFTFSTAYNDNVLTGNSATPASDFITQLRLRLLSTKQRRDNT